MPWRYAVLIITANFYFVCAWDALKIGIINDHPNLSPIFERDLLSAIQWIESTILVQNASNPFNITWIDVSKCAKTSVSQGSKLIYSNGIRIKSLERLLDSSSFNLILKDGPKECQEDPFLLAAAAPCLQRGNERPRLGIMVVCTNSRAWHGFSSGVDLFKHEILHSLGFGMLNPDLSYKRSPKSEVQSHQIGPNKYRKQDIHYLDFASTAVRFARTHFNCPRITGINAENEEKIHLDEYIFGNELMTPILSKGPNYFTHISALILENTFIGDIPWYKTNRDTVEKESRKYWYGRNAGCDFFSQSCYEYARRRSRFSFPFSAFPFCSENDLRSTVSGHKGKLCMGNGTHGVRINAFCHIQPISGPEKDAISLNEMFPLTFKSRSLAFGSVNGYRSCPMISQVMEANMYNIPENAIPIPC
ncbi:unnamed protein product [Bursaphelenchus xylophilus]|nr:unnamed protein product [Bursaphelenchus xylophilus]CAG9096194.1 unnamed protein product [Bursaphelenchus xylophilus]